MKKWISVLLTLAMLASIAVMGVTGVSADSEGIQISVDKTTFAVGEDIKVHYTGLDESYKSKDLELRLDLGGNTSVASKDYVNLTVGEGTEPADVYRGEEGTVSFKDEGYRKAFPYTAGTYTLGVMQYAPTGTIISNTITITIMATELSINKTSFVSGEPIVVSFTSMTGYTGSEIRIDTGWDLDELTYTANRGSFPASKWCDTVASHSDTLSVSYGSDKDRNGNTIAPGKYTLWVMSYSNPASIISNKIEFTITAAPVSTVTTNKTKYVAGEDIVVSFTSYTGYAGADLRMDAGDLDPITYPAARKSSLWCPAVDSIMSDGTYTMKSDKDRNGAAIAPGTYTIWIMCYNPLAIISNKVVITIEAAPKTTVSVNKTEFVTGEPIEVSFTSFTGYDGAEVRIDSGHDLDPLTYPANRKSSMDDAKCSNFMSAGKITFPTDGSRKKTSYPAGDYTVWVMCYANPLAIISNKIEITITDPVAPELSVAKSSFLFGESVAIAFKNIDAGKAGKDLELRVYSKDAQTVGKDSSKMYFILTDKETGALTRGESGTVTFPADDARGNTTIPEGEYVVKLVDAQNNQLADPIEFKVIGLTLSAEKTEFKFGEPITVSYDNLTDATGSSVELRLYPVGYTIGKTQSLAWATLSETSDTLSFPEDDMRNPKMYSDYYPAGKYELVVVAYRSNAWVKVDALPIEVLEPISGAQPMLQESITVTYYVEIDPSVTETKMVYNYKGAEIEVEGESFGNGQWGFDLPEILPQDMNENIAATLYIGDQAVSTKETYSMKQYCMNQLEKTKENEKELRALLVALLNYGTESQKYFEGATEGFANADLTGAQKAYLPVFNIADAENVIETPLSGTADDSYKWKSATLGLFDKISIRFKFQATDISKLVLDINGKSYSGDDFVSVGNNTYAVEFKGVMPESYDETVIAKFMVDSVQVGQTVSYNVNTYLKNKMNADAVKAIVQAIYDYGCAAEAYSNRSPL